MAQLMESPAFMVAIILVVSAVYTWWLWSRLRIGRYDALFCSVGIICFQLIAAFSTKDPLLALVATVYHAALVGGVFSASRGLKKAGS